MTAAAKKKPKAKVKRKAKAPAAKGRPTKCTPSNIKKIADIVRQGHYARVACASVGITEKTYYDWAGRGATGETPYCDFVKSIAEAEAEAQRTLYARVMAHAEERRDGKLVLEVMGRRWGKEWGTTQKHEHTGADGGAIEVNDAAAIRERVQADILRIIRNAGD